MDYRKYGDNIYVRVDRGEEVISSILDACKREGVRSAMFSGIGGCDAAEIKVFDAEAGAFASERIEGILELVSLLGNVVDGGDGPSWHAHALFSYSDDEGHHMAAGHLGSARVRYTAEIEGRPVLGGVIGGKLDSETGTKLWSF